MLCPCNSVCDKCTAAFNKRDKKGKEQYIFHNKCDQKKHKQHKREGALSTGRKAGGYNTKWTDFVLSCFPQSLRGREVKGFIKFYLTQNKDEKFFKQIQSKYDKYEAAKEKNRHKVCLVATVMMHDCTK